MTPNYVLKRKAHYRKEFDGSHALFDACWKVYKRYLRDAIDNPENDDEVSAWLDNIASEKVNNPGSRFYIFG